MSDTHEMLMPSLEKKGFVVAVVVTYHPDLAMLYRLLAKLRDQVHRVIVIDNSANGKLAGDLSGLNDLGSVIPVFLETNVGIASAFNMGCELARKINATHVILFDQDSDPPIELVERLLHIEQDALDGRRRVAVIGPTVHEGRSGAGHAFVRVRGSALVPLETVKNGTFVTPDWLISSGSLINLATWVKIGPFADELFIDLVDVEWCQRAISMGYEVIGALTVKMDHQLGDDVMELPGGLVSIHSPLRCYYQIRNAIALSRRRYMPQKFLKRHVVNFLRLYMLAVLNDKAGLGHLRMLAIGVLHGLFLRLGPYRTNAN